MLIVTFANFFALFLSFIGRMNRNEKLLFKLAIIFLIIFYSIRIDYGNDLPAYNRTFERISMFDFNYLGNNEERVEPGWVVVNLIFSPFGWQIFLTFLTTVQFATIYWLITKYVAPKYYWIIFGLYVLNANLLLTELSMLRQAFAMHICCWATPFILEKKLFKSSIIILLATSIHTSAVTCFLLLLLPYISNTKSLILIISFLVIFYILTIAESLVGDTFKLLFSSDMFEKYQIYEDEKESSGMGIMVMLKVVVSVILILKSISKEDKYFSLSLALAVLTIPFSKDVPLISRIGLYYTIIGIGGYQIISNVKKTPLGFFLLILMFYVYIVTYFSFFQDPVWKEAYGTYHTIFD